MDAHKPPARRGGPSGPPERLSGLAHFAGVTVALAGLCGLVIKQGYPALYALLLTLALGVGCALIMRLLHRGPDEFDDGTGGSPRWA